MSKYLRPNPSHNYSTPTNNKNYSYPKSSITENNNNMYNNNNNNSNTYNNNNDNNTINKYKMYLLQKQENRIDPYSLPRPSEFEDYYQNSDKKNIFYTAVGSHPPHSTSKFIVKETENSSCRLIRSSFVKLPIDQSLLLKTGILFGLYCQPFADFNDSEKKIPVVDGTKGIFRCKRCNSYINNKFNLTYNKSSQRILICNICQNENILNNDDFTSEKYFKGDNNDNDELSNPTVDYIPPETLTKKTKKFIPHYCIMIDISSVSYNLGFPNYILNSFQSNLNNFNNAENSFICFATYDNKGIQFYTLNKNKEIHIYFMNDIYSPFSPVSPKHIFYNTKNDQDDIIILIEKINLYIAKRRENALTGERNIGGTAICAAIDTLYEYGGRVMIFSCTSNKDGYGVSSLNNDGLDIGLNLLNKNNDNNNIKKNKVEEEKKLLNTENEYKLYGEQNRDFYEIIEKCNKNRIAVDQFIFGEIDYDLNKLEQISNCTGGGIYHYKFNQKTILNDTFYSLNYYYEKIFYDITRIISRNNVYGVNVVLRNVIGIEILEILGGINNITNNNTSFFNIASFDPDSSFIYNLKIDDYFINNQKVDFQLVVFYTDNFSNNYLRVINYTILACDSIEKIFSDVDIEVTTKLTLCKELNNLNRMEGIQIRENLIEKISESFASYKKATKQNSSPQLILPAQIKFLPPYVNSFFKKLYLKKNKALDAITTVIALKHFITRTPIYSVLLYLYPKLYKIKITDLNFQKKIRLSGEDIKGDRMYLSCNGIFVDLYIFNYLDEEYYKLFFGYNTFDECMEDIDNVRVLNEDSLGQAQNEAGPKILEFIEDKRKENIGFYLPVRIFFVLKENAMKFDELKNLLVEDEFNLEESYCNELVKIHNKIQYKVK